MVAVAALTNADAEFLEEVPSSSVPKPWHIVMQDLDFTPTQENAAAMIFTDIGKMASGAENLLGQETDTMEDCM